MLVLSRKYKTVATFKRVLLFTFSCDLHVFTTAKNVSVSKRAIFGPVLTVLYSQYHYFTISQSLLFLRSFRFAMENIVYFRLLNHIINCDALNACNPFQNNVNIEIFANIRSVTISAALTDPELYISLF